MKKKKIVALIIFLLAIVTIGISLILTQTRNAAKKEINAELLLQEIYNVTQEDKSAFLALNGEEEFFLWMDSKFGTYLTKDGLEGALQNRILARGIKLLIDSDQQLTVTEIFLDKKSGETAENWYDYKVSLALGDDVDTIHTGSIYLKKSDSDWLVDKITRNN